MSFSILYKELFRINILHRFFLNKGIETFDSMNEAGQEKQLNTYDFRQFFEIIPTPETNTILNNYRLKLRVTTKAISLWGKVINATPNKPFIELDDSLSFTFMVNTTDPKFMNYTNLNPNYTLKTFYFSNKTHETEATTFPLISLEGTNTFVDESYALAQSSEVNEFKNLPFNLKNKPFGLIRIFIKGRNGNYHITNSQGEIPSTIKNFEIVFDNRKTYWRYLFTNDQTINSGDDVEVENGNARILVSKTELPLTNRGFVKINKGSTELPNAVPSSIIPEETTNKIFSEIFV